MAPRARPTRSSSALARSAKALAQPDVVEKNRIADYVPTNLDPKQSAAWLAENRDRWTRVIQQAGITAE